MHSLVVVVPKGFGAIVFLTYVKNDFHLKEAPRTPNTSASGNEDLESLKNKCLKLGSKRDNSLSENVSAVAEGLDHRSGL